MATTENHAFPAPENGAPQHPAPQDVQPELRLYSHSPLVYWWPVWAVGFGMALLTYLEGQPHEVGDAREYYHPSSNLAICYFITLFLVMLVTNVTARGLASGLVVMTVILITVLLAYFDLWDPLLRWFGDLSLHMSLGCYLFASTLIFAAWFLSVFVFDRMTYWRITPGQVTEVRLFGAGARSYETDNMIVEKYRNDLFRHWILGLGAGDVKIRTGGMRPEDLNIPNVLFAGYKVERLQSMIAERPDQFPHAAIQ